MKKRYWIGLLSLIALVFFVEKFIRIRPSNPSPLQNLAQRNVELADRAERVEINTNLSSSDIAKFKNYKVDPDVIKEASRAACYRRLDSQVQSSNDFLSAAKPAISKVVGEWYYRKDPSLIDVNSNSPKQEKFFLALARAGLLDGIEVDLDRGEALNLLLEVAKEDTSNSAPLVYAAVIRKRNGDEAGAEKLLEAARKRPYFDSYVNDFVRAMQSQIQSPSDLMTATSTWSEVAVPNYLAMKPLVSSDEKLSRQLIEKAMKVKGENPFEQNYVLIEYALGRSFLDKMGLAKDLPQTKEFIAKTMNYSNGFLAALEKNCDLSDLDPTVEALKRTFEK